MKFQTPILKANVLRRAFALILVWSFGMLSALCETVSTTGNLTVQIVPRFNGNALDFDKPPLANSSGQNFSVTRLSFLISDFALRHSDGSWLEKTNWQAFLNLGENRSPFVVENIPAGSYDKIRFHVGLRPEINHSKPEQYPANHPLNPNLNGLHWGWAGGYVFFAIEGNWRTSDGKLSGYSFHLGNDPMLMTIELPLVPNFNSGDTLELALDLNRLFDFKLSEENSSTHSREGDELAPSLRKKVEQSFSISPERRAPQVSKQSEKNQGFAEHVSPTATPYRFVISSKFPIPDLPRDNPLTEEGVELGRRLFEEKLLSINGQQSCASCHDAGKGFAENKRVSIGAEGIVGTRNAMPLFNLAWKKNFFWDGRTETLREQVLQPIENPIEMHDTLTNVVAKLVPTKNYPALFSRAFGSTQITSDRIARALEQFILTQISSDSKFDRAMDGKENLTEEEKRGFELFITEYDPRREQFGADCFHCHGGPLFQSQSFANNGLDLKLSDFGRFDATRKDGDKGKFSVPSLRNVVVTGPYMHDGRFNTLEEVVEHYSTGVKRSETLDPNLAKHPDGGIQLSEADKEALVAFLKTLTDEKFRQPSTTLVKNP